MTDPSQLEGAELDAAVARIEGAMGSGYDDLGDAYAFSALWECAGPIIERERIDLDPPEAHELGSPDAWSAIVTATDTGEWACGPTPLIAAMRAYVASKQEKERGITVHGKTLVTPEELKEDLDAKKP